jgi:hypothetical protein
MSSEVKQMLIDAIIDRKNQMIDRYEKDKETISYSYVEAYSDACDEILELVEGILP